MLSRWGVVLGLLAVPMVVEAANQNSVFQIDTTALTKASWTEEDIQKVVDNINMVSRYVDKEIVTKLLKTHKVYRRELESSESSDLMIQLVLANDDAGCFFRHKNGLNFQANSEQLLTFSAKDEGFLIFETNGNNQQSKEPKATIVAYLNQINRQLRNVHESYSQKISSYRFEKFLVSSSFLQLWNITDPADGFW